MNSTVVVRANAQAEPSLIVFGRDDAGKPRASWFDAGKRRPRHQSRRGDEDAHFEGRDRGAEGCRASTRTGARVCQRPGVYAVCSRSVFSQLVELAASTGDPSANGKRQRNSAAVGPVRRHGCQGRAQPRPRQPPARPSGRRTGTKSALAAWCWRPWGRGRVVGKHRHRR